MSLKQKICDALCSGITIREVPMGLAIRSPFDWLTGDKLTFYAREKGTLIRFEDSGSTIFDLESAGVDLTTSTRLAILETLRDEYAIHFDSDDVVFHTEWVESSQAGIAAIRFLSFLQRVQDLVFTTREKVSSTFREDLVSALRNRFQGEATIDLGEAPVDSLRYYTVDIVVKHRNGRVAAIFPGTSEQKALEAVLFAKEIELKHIDNVIPFLIYEQTGSSKIHRDTQAKAYNSELQLAAWDGGPLDVVDKVAKHVSAVT